MAKIWIATEMTATILNFLGKILCCPPIVYSPKGRPQATRTVKIAITPNKTAPNIGNINPYSPFVKYKNFNYKFNFVSLNIPIKL